MIRGLRIPCKAQGGSEQNEFRPWCSNLYKGKIDPTNPGETTELCEVRFDTELNDGHL
jgi:hypothetical protein